MLAFGCACKGLVCGACTLRLGCPDLLRVLLRARTSRWRENPGTCRRHLDLCWMCLIFSPPGPTTSLTFLCGTTTVASGSSSSSLSSRMADSLGMVPVCTAAAHEHACASSVPARIAQCHAFVQSVTPESMKMLDLHKVLQYQSFRGTLQLTEPAGPTCSLPGALYDAAAVCIAAQHRGCFKDGAIPFVPEASTDTYQNWPSFSRSVLLACWDPWCRTLCVNASNDLAH